MHVVSSLFEVKGVPNLVIDNITHEIIPYNVDYRVGGRTSCNMFEWFHRETFDMTKGAALVWTGVTCLLCLTDTQCPRIDAR